MFARMLALVQIVLFGEAMRLRADHTLVRWEIAPARAGEGIAVHARAREEWSSVQTGQRFGTVLARRYFSSHDSHEIREVGFFLRRRGRPRTAGNGPFAARLGSVSAGLGRAESAMYQGFGLVMAEHRLKTGKPLL